MKDYAQEYLRLRYPGLQAKLVPIGERQESSGLPEILGPDADLADLFFSIGGWKELALRPSFRVWNEGERFLNLAVSAFRQRVSKPKNIIP
jgi:hypothetical protein